MRKPTRVSHKTVFEGRVFKVERDVIALATGRRATIDIVRHRGSVILIPMPAPDRVILIRQYRYVIDRSIWELPAGTLEKGERADRAARRECEEEIGLTPHRLRRLASFYPTPGICDELMTFYRCEQLAPPRGPVETDVDEIIEPRTFTLAEARALVDRGQIIDMKTVLGLVLVGAAPRPARPRR